MIHEDGGGGVHQDNDNEQAAVLLALNSQIPIIFVS
jgi:hypothetical protein